MIQGITFGKVRQFISYVVFDSLASDSILQPNDTLFQLLYHPYTCIIFDLLLSAAVPCMVCCVAVCIYTLLQVKRAYICLCVCRLLIFTFSPLVEGMFMLTQDGNTTAATELLLLSHDEISKNLRPINFGFGC